MLALIAICSVEPMEVRVTYEDTPVNDEGIYTVACHNKTVVSSRGRLSLKDSDGVTISRADYDLGYNPDELHSHYSDDDETIHILAVAHAERSLLNKVSHCTYYADRDQEFICRRGESLTPPARFVISTLVDEPGENLYVWIIYFDDNYHEYTIRDLLEENDELPLLLPENCSCSEPSDCLQQDDEPNGKVRILCNSGISYLYNIRSEYFFILPPNVKRVATSRHKDLIFAAQPAEGQYQEDLVVMNMVTNSSQAAAQPVQGVLGISSNPATIQGVTTVSVNATLEVCFFIRGNEISYFRVVDLGTLPVIESLPLRPDLTPIAFRDKYESSVIVVATNSNGSLVPVTIEVVQLGDTSANGSNSTSGSNDTSIPSSTPPTCRPTRPCTADRPTNDDDDDHPTRSTLSGGGGSNNFDIASYIFGLVTGLILAAAILLLWRLRQYLKNCRKYDINNTDPS